MLDAQDMHNIRDAIHSATGTGHDNVLVTVTHTHGAGWMSRTRSHLPGGALIGPYLDELAPRIAEVAREAQVRVAAATIVYGTGRAIWPRIATTSTRNENVSCAGSIRRDQPTTRC